MLVLDDPGHIPVAFSAIQKECISIDALKCRITPSRAENQKQEDHEEQQVNAALQDARLAAGKGNDADGQGE